jgi:hypothetical protein
MASSSSHALARVAGRHQRAAADRVFVVVPGLEVVDDLCFEVELVRLVVGLGIAHRRLLEAAGVEVRAAMRSAAADRVHIIVGLEILDGLRSEIELFGLGV